MSNDTMYLMGNSSVTLSFISINNLTCLCMASSWNLTNRSFLKVEGGGTKAPQPLPLRSACSHESLQKSTAVYRNWHPHGKATITHHDDEVLSLPKQTLNLLKWCDVSLHFYDFHCHTCGF